MTDQTIDAASAAAAALGALGGRKRSEAKTEAARANGQKGGRPRTRPSVRYRCARCRKTIDGAASRAPFCPTRHRTPVRMLRVPEAA
jgi:hypothetical protein